MIRATESDHQLDEILVDFWTNHFNVFINKGQDRAYFSDYLEKTIRGHALGKFEDLLIATAKSPAMLFYLDNAESVAERHRCAGAAGARPRWHRLPPGLRARTRPLSESPGRLPTDPAAIRRRRRGRNSTARQRAPRGLNENYARELMELHTLGVDGGYTQQDVINVARILTGWTIDRRDASYTFREPVHDDRVQGGARPEVRRPGTAKTKGCACSKMLAKSPPRCTTSAQQLCARFVNDVPPDGCIDDAVACLEEERRRDPGGGARDHPVTGLLGAGQRAEQGQDAARVRGRARCAPSAARPDSTPRLAQRVAQLGEPLFQKQTPDGYGERQEDWVNSGSLLARMNFAVQLASGRMPGVAVDLDRVVPRDGRSRRRWLPAWTRRSSVAR